MATDPLRLRILKALTTALGEIRPNDNAPDSTFSLEDSVFRGRVLFGTNDPLPMLSILEVPIPIDQRDPPGDSPSSHGTWELIVQGFAPDDRDNPTDPAQHLMAQVKARLIEEREKRLKLRDPSDGILGMGNHVTDIRISPGVTRPPDELSAKAYFWLAIALELVEDLSNPYED